MTRAYIERRPVPRILLSLLFPVILAGCTFDTSNLGECRNNNECASGVCNNRTCMPVVDQDASDADLDLALDPELDLPELACTAGAAFCDGQVAVTCEADEAENRTDCTAASTCPRETYGCRCFGGDCIPRVCEPSTIGCIGNDRIDCDDVGGSYEVLETCDVSEVCAGGSCVPASCTPSSAACIEDVLLI